MESGGSLKETPLRGSVEEADFAGGSSLTIGWILQWALTCPALYRSGYFGTRTFWL